MGNLVQPDPKVSIIIPTYNNAKYLAEVISSVLQQNFELSALDHMIALGRDVFTSQRTVCDEGISIGISSVLLKHPTWACTPMCYNEAD